MPADAADAGSALDILVSSPGVETPSAPAPAEEQSFEDLARELGLTADGQPLPEISVQDELAEGEVEPEESSDGDEPAAAERPSPQALTLEQKVAYVREDPRHLDEFKARERAEIVSNLLAEEQRVAIEAARMAYERGAQEAGRRVAVQAAFAEVQSLEQDDPEGYRDWQNQYPDRALAYLQIKRGQTSGPDPRVAQANGIIQAAGGVLERLGGSPEAQAVIQAKHQAQPYVADPEGLARLAQDVADALADAKAAGRAKADEPARKAAAQRESAAKTRSDLPRTPGGEGTGAAGALTPEAVKKMSTAEVAAYMRRPGGEEAIDKALAAIATSR